MASWSVPYGPPWSTLLNRETCIEVTTCYTYPVTCPLLLYLGLISLKTLQSHTLTEPNQAGPVTLLNRQQPSGLNLKHVAGEARALSCTKPRGAFPHAV